MPRDFARRREVGIELEDRRLGRNLASCVREVTRVCQPPEGMLRDPPEGMLREGGDASVWECAPYDGGNDLARSFLAFSK